MLFYLHRAEVLADPAPLPNHLTLGTNESPPTACEPNPLIIIHTTSTLELPRYPVTGWATAEAIADFKAVLAEQHPSLGPPASFDLKFQDEDDGVADTLSKRTCLDIIRETIPCTAVLIWKSAEDDQEAAAAPLPLP